ncbi:hypothetical protein HK405_011316, partial [Cladochytrium tenue]
SDNDDAESLQGDIDVPHGFEYDEAGLEDVDVLEVDELEEVAEEDDLAASVAGLKSYELGNRARNGWPLKHGDNGVDSHGHDHQQPPEAQEESYAITELENDPLDSGKIAAGIEAHIKVGDSIEAVVAAAVMERNELRDHAAQMWKIIEKQRAVIQQLNDERAKDKAELAKLEALVASIDSVATDDVTSPTGGSPGFNIKANTADDDQPGGVSTTNSKRLSKSARLSLRMSEEDAQLYNMYFSAILDSDSGGLDLASSLFVPPPTTVTVAASDTGADFDGPGSNATLPANTNGVLEQNDLVTNASDEQPLSSSIYSHDEDNPSSLSTPQPLSSPDRREGGDDHSALASPSARTSTDSTAPPPLAASGSARACGRKGGHSEGWEFEPVFAAKTATPAAASIRASIVDFFVSLAIRAVLGCQHDRHGVPVAHVAPIDTAAAAAAAAATNPTELDSAEDVEVEVISAHPLPVNERALVFVLHVRLRQRAWHVERGFTDLQLLDMRAKAAAAAASGSAAPVAGVKASATVEKSVFNRYSMYKFDHRKLYLEQFVARLVAAEPTSRDLIDFLTRDAFDVAVEGAPLLSPDPTVVKKGFLARKGKGLSPWKTRFYILRSSGVLECYEE